jgi:hypothetical protein
MEFGFGSQGGKEKELYTFCDIVLYDILRKEIVFHRTSHENRSVRGQPGYSWTGILTTEQWKEEWQKDQTKRKLDRNARSIRKRMGKEISEYLWVKN